MNAEKKHGILVIGIGNEYRRDDAVGLMVARRLREAGLQETEVLEENGEGISLMEIWKDARTVFLIDAVQSNRPPGTLHRWDAKAQSVPAQMFHFSTHAVGLPAALELARALNRLPSQVVVYGIEGKSFEAGLGLSLEVSDAVEDTVASLYKEIQLCLEHDAESINE